LPCLPTIVSLQSGVIGHCELLDFSRYISVMMLALYGIYLWFQVKLVPFPPVAISSTGCCCAPVSLARALYLTVPIGGAGLPAQLKTHTELFEDEDDEEEDEDLGLYGSLAWMALLTVLISFLSELLVGCAPLHPLSPPLLVRSWFSRSRWVCYVCCV
jgi:Ca2+/H+ antiporter